MKKGFITKLFTSASLIWALSLTPSAMAEEEKATSLEEAIKDSKVLANFRLRLEGAEFDNITKEATALTYRARIGFESGAFANTKLLAEFDHIQDIIDDFNSTLNGKSAYPVIADPNVTELNRLQLTNTSLPDTKLILGRQRIILGDARFVGNGGWRQNEQTYDGVRLINNSIEGLTVDLSYIEQVNRIFGPDSAMGRFDSDSWLFNMAYVPKMDGIDLKFTGYAYLLDISASALSSETYGGSVSIKKGMWGVKAAYASQFDYAGQPIDYSEDYYHIEVSAAKTGFNGAIGYEVLGGDGVKAFTTPLAALHKFNGFADVFLATPANGLEDLYLKAGYKTKPAGPFAPINMFAVYHDFTSEQGGIDYGSELDLVIATKIGKTGVVFKYADYSADNFATDRTRYSIQLDYKF